MCKEEEEGGRERRGEEKVLCSWKQISDCCESVIFPPSDACSSKMQNFRCNNHLLSFQKMEKSFALVKTSNSYCSRSREEHQLNRAPFRKIPQIHTHKIVFGELRFAQQEGNRRGGQTWWVLVAGEGRLVATRKGGQRERRGRRTGERNR